MLSNTEIKSVKTLIDVRASQWPEKVFLYVPETQQTLSYKQLQDNCRKIEALLGDKKIKESETVAFLMDNGLWTACLFLGVMYSGRTVLPLNAVAGPDQLAYTIEHSELRLIFCSDRYQDQYQHLFSPEKQSHLSFSVVNSSEDVGPIGIDTFEPIVTEKIIDANSTALMIYTSGTTGRPKGVLLSQKNVLSGGRNTVQAHRLGVNDIGLCVLPLYHINAEMVSVMAPLMSAGSVVMPRKLSISLFWSWVANFQCTWFSAVPTIFSYLLEHQQSEQVSHHHDIDFDVLNQHLRFGRSASAALSPAVHEAFEEFFGVQIIETMGISECAAQILSNPLQREVDYYGSPGVPIGNEMRVVGEDHQPVENNVIGEIAVRGSNIMKGYFKNPEATAEVLDNNGWFYTGDLGYRNDDGYFFITGRSKELIIRGGENIAPREIDDVLYKRKEVLEAAAFGAPSELYGQEVLACVSLKPGAQCSEEDLLGHCQSLLGKIRSPKRIYIIGELPKGPSGKIQRLKLVDRVFE
ncbi:MAG: AMP-binding protein [Arenicella sp.]